MHLKITMSRQAKMMSIKNLGKPSKEMRKLTKKRNQITKSGKSSAQLKKEWAEKTHTEVLIETTIKSGLLALMLRPWRWERVRLERVKAVRKSCNWKSAGEDSLKNLLPDWWDTPSGWSLWMSERLGKTRRIVRAWSKSLREDNNKKWRAWEDAVATWEEE